MKRIFMAMSLMVFSIAAFGAEGFECERSDGEAVLTAKYIDATRAEVSEVEEPLGWAVTADYEQKVFSGKPLRTLTTFSLDNGGVLDVVELGSKKVGILRFSAGSIPLFYNCQTLSL
ncbi:MAG: hypothetical protein WD025_04405 [Bacteriovoracaceae bacterium]